MADKHLSSQFDSELNQVSTRVLEMGGLVENQIQQVMNEKIKAMTKANGGVSATA